MFNLMHNIVKTSLCPRTVTPEFNIPATKQMSIHFNHRFSVVVNRCAMVQWQVNLKSDVENWLKQHMNTQYHRSYGTIIQFKPQGEWFLRKKSEEPGMYCMNDKSLI